MKESAINKLKSKAMGLASTTFLRVELAHEESKLKTKFQALGKKLHLAIQGDILTAIKDDPQVVMILGDIEETKRRIAELERQVAGDKVEQ